MSGREILISGARHATSFHLELGTSKLAACGENAQADREFSRVSLEKARSEHKLVPCKICPIPEEWLEDDRLPYQRESELRDTYETEGSLRGAATHFDASDYTVRHWPIEHGIHEPEVREYNNTSKRLEALGRGDSEVTIS